MLHAAMANRENGGSEIDTLQPNFPFVPAVFIKVLAAVLTVVALGLGVMLAVNGEIQTQDMIGSLISAPLLAYLVHLWITMGRDW